MTGIVATKRRLRGAALGLVALGLALSCGRAVDAPQAGSNSNWLKTCGATPECGGELECLCGKCTKECWSSTQCPQSECQVRPSDCDAHVSVTSICGVPGAELLLEDVRREDEGPLEAEPGPAASSTEGAPTFARSDLDCLNIGCVDAMGVSLVGPNQQWPLGRYAIRFELDEGRWDCAFDNEVSNDAGVIESLQCTPEDPAFTARAVQTADCDPFPCTFETGTRAVQFALHRTPPARDAILSIGVQRDGADFFEATQPVRYEDRYPAGERCGGACLVAEVELTLPE
jgi:hypothetical protein